MPVVGQQGRQTNANNEPRRFSGYGHCASCFSSYSACLADGIRACLHLHMHLLLHRIYLGSLAAAPVTAATSSLPTPPCAAASLPVLPLFQCSAVWTCRGKWNASSYACVILPRPSLHQVHSAANAHAYVLLSQLRLHTYYIYIYTQRSRCFSTIRILDCLC